jgi:hypothetical protein
MTIRFYKSTFWDQGRKKKIHLFNKKKKKKGRNKSTLTESH